jgi:1-acyl-sn-glycerol-3-phosphate acyltransferase
VIQTAPCGPGELADAIIGFVARKAGIPQERVRALIERIVEEAGPDAIARLQARLGEPADRWGYYEREPLARMVHYQLAPIVLQKPPSVAGAEHLDQVRGRATIIVANHLSYSDANVIQYLLQQCGHGDVADRLAVIAGPKIYSDLSRRFSSLCFGTIKTPQNEGVSSGEAAMNARDVARAARQTLAAADARLAAGDALLIFPEGTRSRSGAMQPFLAGVARYFDRDEVMVVPIGLRGTEQMFAIGEERLGAATVAMTIGEPLPVAAIRDASGDNRRQLMDVLGAAVAAQLPEHYRGVYSSPTSA